jgi:hypothetical protein
LLRNIVKKDICRTVFKFSTAEKRWKKEWGKRTCDDCQKKD